MTSSIALSCPNSMASFANLWPAANCTGALLLHVAFFFLCGHQGPQSGDFFSFFGVVVGGRGGGGPETPLYIYKQNFLNGKASVIILFFLGITNSLEGHMTSSPPLLSYEDCIYVICRSTPPTRPPIYLFPIFSPFWGRK